MASGAAAASTTGANPNTPRPTVATKRAASAKAAAVGSAEQSSPPTSALSEWLPLAKGALSGLGAGLMKLGRSAAKGSVSPAKEDGPPTDSRGIPATPAGPKTLNEMKRAVSGSRGAAAPSGTPAGAGGADTSARSADTDGFTGFEVGGQRKSVVRLSEDDWKLLESQLGKGDTNGSKGKQAGGLVDPDEAFWNSPAVTSKTPKLAPPPTPQTPGSVGKAGGSKSAQDDALSALWSSTKPSRPPLVNESTPKKGPASLSQLKTEKKQEENKQALQVGLRELGGKLGSAAAESDKQARDEAERLFREREERRRSTEASERAAAEQAQATEEALRARFRVQKPSSPVAARRSGGQQGQGHPLGGTPGGGDDNDDDEFTEFSAGGGGDF